VKKILASLAAIAAIVSGISMGGPSAVQAAPVAGTAVAQDSADPTVGGAIKVSKPPKITAANTLRSYKVPTAAQAKATRLKKAPGKNGVVLPPAPGDPVYKYADGNQGFTTNLPYALYANLFQANPFLDSTEATAGAHSLMELAFIKTTPTGPGGSNVRQIIEIGWTVDRNLNGDYNTHMFSGAWVNDVFLGYNLDPNAGFVKYTGVDHSALYPGDTITGTGVAKSYYIQYDAGNYWLRYDNKWVGYYPGSKWTSAGVSTFTNADNTQAFTEIATIDPRLFSCSDMGTGDQGSTGTLPNAYIGSVGYLPTTTATPPGPTPNMFWHMAPSTLTEYSIYGPSGRTAYTGGPGRNLTDTATGTKGSC
jgi:hypothetical protein